LTVKLDTSLLFNTFKVASFEQLEQGMQSLAPSMIEYYLSDLSSSVSESFYINKSNIQKTIFLDEYSLYLDYEDFVYLEFIQKDNFYDTESLW